jgi:hypothetical protein
MMSAVPGAATVGSRTAPPRRSEVAAARIILELRPESTKRRLRVAQRWITGHARQLIAFTLIIAGPYMTVTGLIRLS